MPDGTLEGAGDVEQARAQRPQIKADEDKRAREAAGKLRQRPRPPRKPRPLSRRASACTRSVSRPPRWSAACGPARSSPRASRPGTSSISMPIAPQVQSVGYQAQQLLKGGQGRAHQRRARATSSPASSTAADRAGLTRIKGPVGAVMGGILIGEALFARAFVAPNLENATAREAVNQLSTAQPVRGDEPDRHADAAEPHAGQAAAGQGHRLHRERSRGRGHGTWAGPCGPSRCGQGHERGEDIGDRARRNSQRCRATGSRVRPDVSLCAPAGLARSPPSASLRHKPTPAARAVAVGHGSLAHERRWSHQLRARRISAGWGDTMQDAWLRPLSAVRGQDDLAARREHRVGDPRRSRHGRRAARRHVRQRRSSPAWPTAATRIEATEIAERLRRFRAWSGPTSSSPRKRRRRWPRCRSPGPRNRQRRRIKIRSYPPWTALMTLQRSPLFGDFEREIAPRASAAAAQPERRALHRPHGRDAPGRRGPQHRSRAWRRYARSAASARHGHRGTAAGWGYGLHGRAGAACSACEAAPASGPGSPVMLDPIAELSSVAGRALPRRDRAGVERRRQRLQGARHRQPRRARRGRRLLVRLHPQRHRQHHRAGRTISPTCCRPSRRSATYADRPHDQSSSPTSATPTLPKEFRPWPKHMNVSVTLRLAGSIHGPACASLMQQMQGLTRERRSSTARSAAPAARTPFGRMQQQVRARAPATCSNLVEQFPAARSCHGHVVGWRPRAGAGRRHASALAAADSRPSQNQARLALARWRPWADAARRHPGRHLGSPRLQPERIARRSRAVPRGESWRAVARVRLPRPRPRAHSPLNARHAAGRSAADSHHRGCRPAEQAATQYSQIFRSLSRAHVLDTFGEVATQFQNVDHAFRLLPELLNVQDWHVIMGDTVEQARAGMLEPGARHRLVRPAGRQRGPPQPARSAKPRQPDPGVRVPRRLHACPDRGRP